MVDLFQAQLFRVSVHFTSNLNKYENENKNEINLFVNIQRKRAPLTGTTSKI